MSINEDQPKRGRPPKEGVPATGHIHIRTALARKGRYTEAARKRNLNLTEWVIDVCDRASGYNPDKQALNAGRGKRQ